MDHMNNHTIIEHLKSHPELQSDAVLITDHCTPPMFFGGLPNVQRRLFKSTQISPPNLGRPEDQMSFHRLVTGPIPAYDKAGDTQSIKLVELALHSSYVNIMRKEQGMGAPCRYQDIDVDETTFIFIPICRGIQEYRFWNEQVVSLEHRLDQFTEAKWHVGAPVYYSDTPEDVKRSYSFRDLTPAYTVPGKPNPRYGPDPLLFPQLSPGPVIWSTDILEDWLARGRLHNLQTLRLEGVYTIPPDLEFPLLEQLCLVFNQEPPLPSRRPWIHGLKAPLLTAFTVHFNKLIPHFRSTWSIGSQNESTPLARASPFKTLKTFELASYRLLDHSRHGISEDVAIGLDRKRPYTQLRLPFLKNFGNFIIGGGVPLALLRPRDLERVRSIQWHVNSPEDSRLSEIDAGTVDHRGAPALDVPGLYIIRLHVTGQGVVLPRLLSRGLLNAAVSTLSLDVSVYDFLHSVPLCNKFALYSSPRLVQKDPANLNRTFFFSEEQWISILDRWIWSRMNSVTLIGFQMGSFLYMESTKASSGTFRWFSPMVFHVSPVICPDTSTSSQGICYRRATLKLNKLHFTGRGDETTKNFTITPIIIGPAAALGFKLTLDMCCYVSHHAYSVHSRCNIGISTVFDEFIFNGKVLEMKPNKDWEEEVKRESNLQYHKLTPVESHRWEVPLYLWKGSPRYLPRAMTRFNPIIYNPYVRFPNDPKAYTAYHRTDYRSGWCRGEPPRYC